MYYLPCRKEITAKLSTSEEETLIRASKEVHKWVGEEDMAKIVTEAGALLIAFNFFCKVSSI